MRKALPYILGSVVLVAALALIFTGASRRAPVLNERPSFRKKDKIPYGTWVAYEGLKHLFPGAAISAGSARPGDWDSLSYYEGGQALIIISPWFFADEEEFKKLIRFAEGGNNVLVSSAILSDDAKDLMNCSVSYVDIFDLIRSASLQPDSLTVGLTKPPFTRSAAYGYPGKKFEAYFSKLDSSITTVLGWGSEREPDFIHLKAGSGNLYIHLAPVAFTNYFLLHDKNMKYYEDILSVIPRETKRVVWDEYYLTKRFQGEKDQQRKGWLATLLGYPAMKWGLLVALLTLLLYFLLEMRRKQRYIPALPKPRNDSLDFVKTIGRLYFDKGDHKNLCRKMAAYFLEHVRNRYKLATGELNEDFIRQLQFKTGANESRLRSIVRFIRDLESLPAVSEHQLAHFHRELESFYSKN